ncbi:hypothetical protein GCM10023188_35950 [Pontibacter saemangeumensis]|uniref:Uncharacterized protein n=2 Tax=Pontibacter saemangeumensis TaxID=1084525 RepID=A0ABP8LZF1_9BACT
MLFAIMSGVVVLVILGQMSFFNTAADVFTNRYESANEVEGGIEGVFLDRFLGGLLGALTGASDLPFWGFGLGMGTNVGSVLLSGTKTFLISEGEWGRVVGELGPLLGLCILYLRVELTIKITIACYRKMLHYDFLPWMLLSFGLLIIAQGGWAQPTALGYFTMIGGLIMASLRRSSSSAV